MSAELRLQCKSCCMVCSSLDEYMEHMNSRNHAQTVLALTSPASTMPVRGTVFSTMTEPSSLGDSNDFASEPNGVFRCKVCDIFVTGHIPFQQHLIGQKHLKKQKNREMLEAFKQVEKFDLSLNDEDESKNEASGNDEAIHDDLEINVHIRRGALAEEKQNLAENQYENKELSYSALLSSSGLGGSKLETVSIRSAQTTITSEVYPYRCETCDKSFNGTDPYFQHMKSPVHFRKVNQISLMSQNGAMAYYCDVCNISSSGPIPYKQHVMSAKHQKQVIVKNSFPNVCGPSTYSEVSSNTVSKLAREQQLWQSLQNQIKDDVSSKTEISLNSNNTTVIIDANEAFILSRNDSPLSLNKAETHDEIADGDTDSKANFPVETEVKSADNLERKNGDLEMKDETDDEEEDSAIVGRNENLLDL